MPPARREATVQRALTTGRPEKTRTANVVDANLGIVVSAAF
jgi:hypothetical protein